MSDRRNNGAGVVWLLLLVLALVGYIILDAKKDNQQQRVLDDLLHRVFVLEQR